LFPPSDLIPTPGGANIHGGNLALFVQIDYGCTRCIFANRSDTILPGRGTIIGFADPDDLPIGRLQIKPVFTRLGLLKLKAVRKGRVFLHRGNPVHCAHPSLVSLTRQDYLAVTRFQSESKLALSVLVELKFACHFNSPLISVVVGVLSLMYTSFDFSGNSAFDPHFTSHVWPAQNVD
jgi:hypothetical protein